MNSLYFYSKWSLYWAISGQHQNLYSSIQCISLHCNNYKPQLPPSLNYNYQLLNYSLPLCRAVIKGRNTCVVRPVMAEYAWFPLLIPPVKLPVVDRIHLQSNKFALGVENSWRNSKLNDRCAYARWRVVKR